MAHPRPTTAEWDMDEMLGWLAHLSSESTRMHGGVASAYVHPAVLSFNNQNQKNGWMGYEQGVESRDTFQKPNKVKKGKGRMVWVFLCDTPNETYVGKTTTGPPQNQWDTVGQHAWAAAVVARAEGGKDLYIFDCDIDVPTQAREVDAKSLRTQRQRVFISEVRK